VSRRWGGWIVVVSVGFWALVMLAPGGPDWLYALDVLGYSAVTHFQLERFRAGQQAAKRPDAERIGGALRSARGVDPAA
jgi:hypothetical protein